MKQLLITIAALVLVGCGGDENKVRDWPTELILNGEAKVLLYTKYRDGKLLVKVELSPYKGKVEQAFLKAYSRPTITLNFFDSDNFGVTEHSIKVKLMSRVNDKNETVKYLLYDGSFTLPKEKYKLITSYQPSWSGF